MFFRCSIKETLFFSLITENFKFKRSFRMITFGFRGKIALNFKKDEKELTEFYIIREYLSGVNKSS